MVKLLCRTFGMISEQQATVLCVCHEMRRDAFHRCEMNPTILRPVTELHFLTVCEFQVRSFTIAAPTGENAEF